MSSEIELKPCPFCGPGESVVEPWLDEVSHRWRVGCGRCGCSTGIHPRDKTQTPAIAAWNKRPPSSATPGDGEVVIEAVGRVVADAEMGRRVDWLTEGGIGAMEVGDYLCVTNATIPDDGLLTIPQPQERAGDCKVCGRSFDSCECESDELDPQERAGSDAGASEVAQWQARVSPSDPWFNVDEPGKSSLLEYRPLFTHPQPASDASGLPELPGCAGAFHVQQFRDCPSMRNVEFSETSDFAPGSHPLYTAEQMRAYASRALAESRSDAERYRWLRDNWQNVCTATGRVNGEVAVTEVFIGVGDHAPLAIGSLDAAIDAALAVAAQQQEGQ